MLAVPPAVSVIMPVYNRAQYLPYAIGSVQAQTLLNWELIVVDDNSTDNSYTVANNFAQYDPRIRVIRLPANSGNPARPRNAGLNAAKGNRIAFLDSDDFWLPEKLAKQVAFMDETGHEFTFTAMRPVSPDLSVLGKKRTGPDHVDLKTYLGNTCISPCTVMIDRAALDGQRFNEKIKIHEDFEFFARLLKTTNAHFLDQDLTRFRRGHESLSSNIAKVAFNRVAVYMDIGKTIGYPAAARAFTGYVARAFAKRLRF